MTTRRSYGTGSLATKANARGELVWHGRWRDDAGTQVTRKLGLVRQPGSAIGLTEKGAEKALRTRMESHVAAPKAAHDEDGPMTFTRAATQLYAHYQPSGHESDLIDQMFEHDDSADSIAQSIAQSDLI